MQRFISGLILCLLFAVCVNGEVAAAPPPVDWTITLDELISGRVLIPLPDPTQASVIVEPQNNESLDARCTLVAKDLNGDGVADAEISSPTTPACLAVLTSNPGDEWLVHHGDPLRSSRVLKVEQPIDTGFALTWARTSTTDEHNVERIKLEPPPIEPWATDLKFWRKLGGKWIEGTITDTGGKATVEDKLQASLKKADSVVGYAQHDGIWVTVTFKAASSPKPDPGQLDLQAGCDSAEIRAEARGAIGLPPDGGATNPDTLTERELLLGDWYYIVCVDLTDPNTPQTVTLTEPPRVATVLRDRYAINTSESPTLIGGHRVAVVVWGQPGTTVKVDIPGTLDWGKSVYIPPGLIDSQLDTDGEQLRPAPHKRPHVVKEFEPRGGDHLTIEILGKQKKDDKTEVTVYEYKQVRRLQPLYRGALRVGVALSWSPWERTYRASTGTGGTRYIDFDAGNDPLGTIKTGILDLELNLGYSLFFRLRPAHDRSVGGAWYFGAGLVQAGEGGVSVFNSVHTGPELTIGKSVGIALTVSARRTRWLANGAEVGQALPTGDPPTRFGLTPTFSILINLQPAIFEAAGKVSATRFKLFGG